MPNSLTTEQRWSVYVLLITLSAGVMLGRVMSVTANHGRAPFQSANDRSRWSTIRALVDQGTYAIDDVIFKKRGGEFLRDAQGRRVRDVDWHTIDMVRHVDHTGVMRSYSSKPTLLPTLLAGEYWVVKQALGVTLAEHPFYVARVMLVITNVLPLLGAFLLMGLLVDRFGQTDWGRLFAMAFLTFGTFLTTFAVTLNNHLPAVVAATITLYAGVRILYDGDLRWRWFILAGFFAAFTAANELPALAFCCLVGAVLLWKSPLRAIAGFLPAASVVAAGAFGTNYVAHESWRPPYAHRSDGPVVATISTDTINDLDAAKIPAALREKLVSPPIALEVSERAIIKAETPGERWLYSDHDEADRYALVRVGDTVEVREWDRWYQFEGAYWRSGKETKIDQGEPSALEYAFQCLIGHHGIFSLTPVWLLTVLGMGMLLVGGDRRWKAYAALVLLLTLVVVGFYLSRPQLDRTYGGFTTGLRWVFWFAPLWSLLLLPAVDWFATRRWAKGIALALLLASAMSAFYGSANPWTHPWIYDYWTYLGWIVP